MEKILHIETATDICSVTLSDGEEIISKLETSFDRSHAGVLTVFIDEMLRDTKIPANTLDAISVSMGPGSYTGLRIGVSVAKGLSYGLNIPLIAVSTLDAMFHGMKSLMEKKDIYSDTPDIFIPMIDARRLEVYLAVYDKNNIQLEGVQAFIVNENSFLQYLIEKKVLFFGNGSIKVKDIITHKNAIFTSDFVHSSSSMVKLALNKFKSKIFENVAYFEPFYLKDFITTTPKKNILGFFENRA